MPEQQELIVSSEKLWTYQALAMHFGWHPKTVSKKFRFYKKFKDAKNTIRVPESSLKQYLADHTYAPTNPNSTAPETPTATAQSQRGSPTA